MIYFVLYFVLLTFALECFGLSYFKARIGPVYLSEFGSIKIKDKLYFIPTIWMQAFSISGLISDVIVFITVWCTVNIDYAVATVAVLAIANYFVTLLFLRGSQIYSYRKFQKTLYEMVEYLIEQKPEAVNNESYVVIKIKKVLRDNDESCNDRAIKRAFKKYRKLHALL